MARSSTPASRATSSPTLGSSKPISEAPVRSPERRPAARELRIDTTLPRLLEANAQAHGDRIAIREKDAGIWQQTSWSELLEMTLQCAAALQACGLGRGE